MRDQFDLHVDEGHGGADSGAVGGGMAEDTRNLLLGNAVARHAARQGWRVTRTRTTDSAVALADRYAKANKAGADAFVSIHHDWKLGEQAVIYPNSNDGRETRSAKLANRIARRIDPLAPTETDVYADRRGLAVMRGTRMPAVLVEASRVQDKYDADRMAAAIVQGICEYLGVPFVVVTGNRPVKPAPKPHTDSRVLDNGAGGKGAHPAEVAAVKHLQHLLNEAGAKPKLVEDGDFGDLTEKAVRAFQTKHKVKGGSDGVVGENTWRALHKAVAA